MPSQQDHFERLGLPRGYDVDARQIENNYLARSRETHPDFHQQGSASDQRAAMDLSAALNDAYATLRDPFRRAEYLLHLEGGPSASESKEMSPEFLEEMLELRMEIEEARAAGNDAPESIELEEQLQQRRRAILECVAEGFRQFETTADDTKRKSILTSIRQQLNTARFVQGLLRDLRSD